MYTTLPLKAASTMPVVLFFAALSSTCGANEITQTVEIRDKCGHLRTIRLHEMSGLSSSDIINRLQNASQHCSSAPPPTIVKALPPHSRTTSAELGVSGTQDVAGDMTPRSFFIARDRFNMLGELAEPSAYLSSPLGATLSPSDDLQKHQQKISAQAYLSWYAFGNRDSPGSPPVTFGVGPAITFDGDYTNPIPSPPSLSSLRVGPDLQFGIHGGSNYAYGSVAPFYQTDFRGDAHIEGVDLLLEPYMPQLSLGVEAPPSAPNSEPRVVGFSWRFVPEMQFLNVNNPGQTNYFDGTYSWIGANLQSTIRLFPDDNASTQTWLDRISATVGYRFFADLSHAGSTVKQLQAELDYKLPPFIPGNFFNGIPSIGLQYTQGTDIETLQVAKQIKVQFSYKY